MEYTLETGLLRAQFPHQDAIQLICGAVEKYNFTTLEIFVGWLEQKTLKHLHLEDKVVVKAQLLNYIKLFKLASDHRIHELVNKIMDRIRARPTCGEGYFPRFFIEECYKSSEPGRPSPPLSH